MKVALLLFLFGLAEADDVRYEFNLKIQQLKSQLEAQISDMASRLSASETKTGELQTRLNQLQTSYDQLQTSYDQFQDIHNLLTKEQDCLKRKLCEQHGFTFGDGLCYYISTETKNWEESRQWCRDRQSNLMVIKSKEKQDLVERVKKRVWLGLSDRDEEGLFRWVDGTPLTTPTYWMPVAPHGESNKHTNAETDCVEYYDGSQPSHPNGGWNDIICSNPYTFWICEKALC